MSMKKLKVNLDDRSYWIHISDFELEKHAIQIQKFLKEDRLFIVTNTTLKKLYQKKLSKVFENHFAIEWIVIPDGEKYKNLANIEKIHTKLSQKKANRKSTLLAFGGGVVGDICGFVAATYMRGIDFIQMPTTLLSQVDSSVGGKTGVDLSTGKNLVGAFYQPLAVFILTDFLKTLPKREFSCGMAEVIKYGVIWDKKFFTYLQKNKDAILKLKQKELTHIIYQSCKIKALVVSEDEKENGIRAILNFGHTLGHALEALTGFSKIKHGEAIAIGMHYAAKIAYHLDISKEDFTGQIIKILNDYHLPFQWPKINKTKLLKLVLNDKKATSKNIKFILPQKIGKVSIVPLTLPKIKDWI